MAEGLNGASFEVPGYRVRRRIGRGGFAVVYEAEQLSLGRAVALKMLLPEMATERDLRRFERERLLLSELSRHRHVVDVIDAGTTGDGHPFIVMGLYRRGSLAQALADAGPMRPVDVVTLVGKLAGALQAAHNRGVIHRDIKPENVLIADDGEPALADFGISVMTGPDRTTTGNFFTMAHVAPEVLQRGEYGIGSDVYALASTVYLLLAGRSAFRGDNQFAQMRAIVEDPVPPIGRADVPPGVEAVVVRGMAKHPQDRYPSAVAFADELAAAWRAAQATPVSTLPGFPVPGPLTDPGPVPAPAPEPAAAGGPGGVTTLFGPPERPAPASVPLSVTSGEPHRPGRPRRRGAVGAAVAIALALPALFGATYALDVPPGSALRGPDAVAGKPLVIGTAMSQQGFADGDNPTNTAVDLYLDTLGHRVGDHSVAARRYDVATPRWTRWDSDTCVKVARQQLAETDVVGVVGPYNSGCAKLMLPILSGGGGGPVAVVSNGATDPGLTKSWDVGEPGKYYPNGARNFARVVTTDDVQGRAAAIFAKGDLAVTKVFVVNDGAVYGKHIAGAFTDAAKAEGLTVVGEAQWKRGAKDYRALFAKARQAGADAVFLGGAVANNGIQVVRDKVAVLGDNQTVKLLAADGFTGEPKLAALPEAQGMFLTFPGLSPVSIRQRGGAGSRFLDAFQQKYGHDPEDPYAIYAVAAAQVLVEAIRRSDGTRAGVHTALFSTPGVTVPKADSVLGADTRIDWETGDVSIKDVTVQTVKRNAETFETVVTVP